MEDLLQSLGQVRVSNGLEGDSSLESSTSSSSNPDNWNAVSRHYGSNVGAPGFQQRPLARLRSLSQFQPPIFHSDRDFFETLGNGEHFPTPLSPTPGPFHENNRVVPSHFGRPMGRDTLRTDVGWNGPPVPKPTVPTNMAVWSGNLPPRNAKDSAFSCKVFLGGVPWDITEKDLHAAFDHFGSLRIEWPGIHDKNRTRMPKGHLYLIFDNECSIKYLLGACSYDCHHGQHNWFYRVASKRMLVKSVQVIPWQLADATYTHPGAGAVAASSTSKIFVANLHGMITAEGLGRIFNDLFGGVIAATLDTDKTKYPIGSGRITFNNNESHMKAIRAGTVDIRTAKFSRQIKIDPYLEDTMCSGGCGLLGPFFCRDLDCFSYFCSDCWLAHHWDAALAQHQPMIRPARTGASE